MKTLVITLWLILAVAAPALSQETTAVLTPAQRDTAVDKICELLDRFYVIPETATQMRDHLRARHAAGVFDAITDPDDFATSVTTELRSICHDKHLNLYIGANPDEQTLEDRTLTRLLNRLDSRKNNHGLTKVEILDGNVGYMNIRSVMYSEAAMTVLSSVLTSCRIPMP